MQPVYVQFFLFLCFILIIIDYQIQKQKKLRRNFNQGYIKLNRKIYKLIKLRGQNNTGKFVEFLTSWLLSVLR